MVKRSIEFEVWGVGVVQLSSRSRLLSCVLVAACDSTDDDVLIDADDEHLGGGDTSRRLKPRQLPGATPRFVRHTDTATAMLCGSGGALLSPDGQGNAGAQLTSGEAFFRV